MALVAVVLWADDGTAHHWATNLVHTLSLGAHHFLASILSRLSHLKVDTLEIVRAAELGTPSKRSKRWGCGGGAGGPQYLTAVATATFVPLEVHELVQRVTWLTRRGARGQSPAVVA